MDLPDYLKKSCLVNLWINETCGHLAKQVKIGKIERINAIQ